jgi:hypothetical protein
MATDQLVDSSFSYAGPAPERTQGDIDRGVQGVWPRPQVGDRPEVALQRDRPVPGDPKPTIRFDKLGERAACAEDSTSANSRSGPGDS